MPIIGFRSLTVCPALITAALVLAGCAESRPPSAGSTRPPPDLVGAAIANRCAALQAVDSAAFVRTTADGYRATANELAQADAFYLKPTGLRTALFLDRDGTFLATPRRLALQNRATTSAREASPRSDWRVRDKAGAFTIQSLASKRYLTVAADDGALRLDAQSAEAATRFAFVAAQDCATFPEAEVGAHGTPFSGTRDDGTVLGIADVHTHISAHQRLGGRVIHGKPFHRYGIQHALTSCAANHGPRGALDVIGNFVRDGLPAGVHDTAGWPDFPQWPSHDTYTHQQSYYLWVKRTWMAGLRLLVNHTSADEQLCQLAPLKANNCAGDDQVNRQIDGMFALQDYIDAQNGGAGQGWFRIVRNPAEARRVIADGKLAVVLGIESSKLFDCGEFLGRPECTRADIDAGIETVKARGIRSVFVAHWFDNAFGGAGLFDQSEVLLNILNKPETGHYYRVEACPEPGMGANLLSLGRNIDPDSALADLINATQFAAVPTYPEGPHCNARGLTELGAYAINALADHGIIIETDHLGARMKNQVLDIVEARSYPVVAGHFHAGGTSSPQQLARILEGGGIAAPINPDATDYPQKVAMLDGLRGTDAYFGVPMSSDSGGIASLSAPPQGDEPRVSYPFDSVQGDVRFSRQRTGNRTFDYNEDGIAHYGLFADWIQAMSQAPGGEAAVEKLFRSAEAYLRMWEHTQRAQ